jgi:translation initiation factor IF-1
VDVIRPGVVRVELSNGHRLVARRLRRDADQPIELSVGSPVEVEVSPADPSKGILAVRTDLKR